MFTDTQNDKFHIATQLFRKYQINYFMYLNGYFQKYLTMNRVAFNTVYLEGEVIGSKI